jgi:SAM-dependent methyltransferase
MSLLALPKVLKEFSEQSKHPPGNDPYIKACYEAVIKMTSNGSTLKLFIKEVLEERNFTPSHFVNLFFRAIQYTELNESKNPEYPYAFLTPESWELELEKLMKTKRRVIKKILLTRDTGTTKYQRYIGPKTLMLLLSGNKSIKVADFGCGGNYGLRGFSNLEPFEQIKDNTRSNIVEKHKENILHLQQGLGMDKVDPDDPEIASWRLSCSFYPKELHERNKVIAFEDRLKKTRNVAFLKFDLREPLPEHLRRNPDFDYVIISTFFYLLGPRSRKKVLQNALSILKPEGYIIIQDFAQKGRWNAKDLLFKHSWFTKPFLYRTFLYGSGTKYEYWEMFKWDSGRCKEVKSGKDLKKLIQLTKNAKN